MEEEEEEVEMDEMEEMEEEVVMVGQMPTVMVPRHINKRALKNKGLSVAFNDKELEDYVTGFHKRKKKRRKEAQRQLQEKKRLKRIGVRKKRKEEKEFALYGRVSSSEDPNASDPNASGLEPDNTDNDHEEDELETKATVSETKTYEDGCTTITVTTSEISHEGDENLRPKHVVPELSNKSEKNHSLAVKKNPLKRSSKHKQHQKGRRHASQSNKRKSRGGKTR